MTLLRLKDRCLLFLLPFVWYGLLPLPCVALQQQTPGPKPLIAEALPEQQQFFLPPGSKRVFTVDLPAAQLRSISVQQRSGSVQALWQPEGTGPGTAETRTNRSGKDSWIVFHAVGLGPEPSSRHGNLIVLNPGKTPAEVRIVSGPLHSVNDADWAMLEAERYEAAAQATPHSVAGAEASLPMLQAAQKQWRIAQCPVERLRAMALEIYTQAFAANDGAGAMDKLPLLLAASSEIAGISAVEAANAMKVAAFVFAKQADYTNALTQYNGALQLFEQIGDLFNRVVVLENRAKVERIEAHYDLALRDVDAALPLAQREGDARGELGLEVERGAIASASGQLGVAYESDWRAVSLAQHTPNPFLEAIAWSDLAVAYTELHSFAGANRALDRADAVWKASSNAYGALQTLEDRAELRVAEGNLAGARATFATGAEVSAKDLLPREHCYFLRGLAVTEMRSGNLSHARIHLDQAIDEAERAEVKDALSALYTVRGDLSAEEHHWTAATADWTRADTLAVSFGDTLGHVIALGGLIRSEVQTGRVELADGHCKKVLPALESIRGAISDADLRLSFFSSRHALYDVCVQAALRRKDQGSAFDTAERGRARSLLDEAAAAGVLAELPGGMLERLQQNERSLAQARRMISSLRRPLDRSRAAGQIVELLRRREAIRAEAEASGLQGRLAADSFPLSQAEIIRRLDPSTALVAYWLSSTGSVAWVITSRGASVHTLPPARKLEENARSYQVSLLAPLVLDQSSSAADRAQVINSAAQSAREQGVSLRRILLPLPLPPQIHRLLIVKDGALQTISFSSLPLDDGAYLGQRFDLATEPSAAVAFRSTRRRLGTELRSVAFTDPADASASSPTASQGSATSRQITWTVPLPFARQEGQELQQIFGSRNTRVFTGSSASRANALSLDWSQYDLAHFATHAVFRQNHPELSGLILATSSQAPSVELSDPDSAPSHDSLLSFFDVLQMKAPLELVVLNACSSGLGKLVPGEGKLALDNAFLAAGADRVIATLWPVDDQASSVFMHEFYRALALTRSPLASLRAAQQKMASSEEWNAPYYWGAFTLTGDWRPFTR